MAKKRILIVEDDRDINELINYHLTREGYDVLALFDGSHALDMVKSRKPDLVILDLMLPEVDGLEICREIRSAEEISSTPVLMLTAKAEESDVVVGLQLGADDYLTKPFSPKVLLARIKAILRRTADRSDVKDEASGSVRRYADLTIDLLKHKIMLKNTEIVLTTIEFDILEFLSRHPGRVFDRDQILNTVWKEGKFIIDRAVDVHIRGLRKKLGKAEYFIETVRGVGYRFKEL